MQTSDEKDMLLHPPVRQWIEAFNAHDSAALATLYTEDAELFDSGMPRPRYGRGEIADWFRWRFRSTPSISYTPTGQSLGEEGQITVTWIARGHGPRFFGQSRFSRPFQVNGVSNFTLHADLISKQHGTYNHVSVLQQIIPLLNWLPGSVAGMIYRLYLWRNGPHRR